MKKLFVLVVLICLLSSVSYGATSEDMSVYVRQDMFNVKMEAFMSAIQAGNEQIRGDIKELNGKMAGLEKRMSGLETTVYWILGLLSFVVGAIALTPWLKDIRKPEFTLEDVKRLIEENNIRLSARPQM